MICLTDPQIVAAFAAWGNFLVGLAACLALIVGYYQVRRQIQKTNLSNWINTFRSEYAEFAAKSTGVIGDPNAVSWEFEKLGLMIKLYLDPKNKYQKEFEDALQAFAEHALDRNALANQAFLEIELNNLHTLAKNVIIDAQKRI